MGKPVAAKSPVWPESDPPPDWDDGAAVEAWTNRRLDEIPDQDLKQRLLAQHKRDLRRFGNRPKGKGWILNPPLRTRKTNGRYNGTFKKSWILKQLEVSFGRTIMKLIREIWWAAFNEIKRGRDELTIASLARNRLLTKYKISVPKHLLGP